MEELGFDRNSYDDRTGFLELLKEIRQYKGLGLVKGSSSLDRVCAYCDKHLKLTDSLSTKKYCSDACRQAAYRQRRNKP